MRYKVIVNYDGTNFNGFQRQKDYRSVEAEIESVLEKMHKEKIRIIGAGRTDKGVHALGQVFHFDSDLKITEVGLKKGMNSLLPPDIYVVDVKKTSEDFHARYSAVKKEYRYYIRHKSFDLFYRNYAEYIPNIDIDKLKKNIKRLEGSHDFRGFCSAKIAKEKSTIKQIYTAEVIEHDEFLELIFIGDGFLKYQIRTMVGTLIDIATGRKDESIIDEIFESKNPEKTNRVLTGKGLYLISVTY
jgi:tRNA pseudouridine38-40 synthase